MFLCSICTTSNMYRNSYWVSKWHYHGYCVFIILTLPRPGVNLLSEVSPSFTCTVLEAPSPDKALLVCQQIGELFLCPQWRCFRCDVILAEGFQKATWFVPSSWTPTQIYLIIYVKFNFKLLRIKWSLYYCKICQLFRRKEGVMAAKTTRSSRTRTGLGLSELITWILLCAKIGGGDKIRFKCALNNTILDVLRAKGWQEVKDGLDEGTFWPLLHGRTSKSMSL